MQKKTNTNESGNGCKLYKKCGGCQLAGLPYEEQLSVKMAEVIRQVGRFCHVDEIVRMENPYHYRCKVQAAFGNGRNGIVSGVYQSSTHKIVPVDSCLLEDKEADSIIVTIRKLAVRFQIPVFDDQRMSGLLRHVLIRKGYQTHQFLVVLVTAKKSFPHQEEFLAELLQSHPEITSVVQNINSAYTSLVLGKQNIVWFGKGYIEDRLLDCSFRISPSSFFQVNPQITEKLYATVLDFLRTAKAETVIDAYCGTGTIGILASKTAKQVLGIELNEDAVRDAKQNAKLNGIDRINFACADATEYLVRIAEANEKIDALVMDPPRAGSTRQFIGSIAKLKPRTVIYVSCNPETLSRDLMWLAKSGYAVKKIKPFDMFPHTQHVETVALLSRV